MADSLQSQVGKFLGLGLTDLLKGPYDKVDTTKDQLAALWGGSAPSSIDVFVTAPPEDSVGLLTAGYIGPSVEVVITQDSADGSTLKVLGTGNVPWSKQIQIPGLPVDPSAGTVRAWTVYDVPIQVEPKANAAFPAATGSVAAIAATAPGAAGSIAPAPPPAGGASKATDRLWTIALVVLLVVLGVVVWQVAAVGSAARRRIIEG